MGGVENVLKKAKAYFDDEQPDYRWVIELTTQILFYPDAATKEKKCYEDARNLATDAMMRTHPDASPAPAPTTQKDTPPDALCACLELPPENRAIVFPLPDTAGLPG